jgi:hypothetical protein
MSNRTSPAGGTERVVYQSSLQLSTATLTFVGDLLRGHLKKIRSRWRKLPPGRIATIVLAVLRHDQRLAGMAGGNRISATTVRRWVLEAVHLLAARAQRLQRSLKKLTRKGGHVVLIDGTLIRTRRCTGADNRRNYSGKHKAHGLLFLALTDDKGRLLWISAARPGRSSEITTAATTNSSSSCAPTSWAPSATSASPAWTTTRTTRWSSPATRPPAPSHSPRRRSRSTG